MPPRKKKISQTEHLRLLAPATAAGESVAESPVTTPAETPATGTQRTKTTKSSTGAKYSQSSTGANLSQVKPEAVLSPALLPHLEGWHIGIDEAGRGCLAGPVTAGAVLAPAGFNFKAAFAGLTDSKAVKEQDRLRLAAQIKSSPLFWGIGQAWPAEIDQVNILNATFRAMSRAVWALWQRYTRFLHGADAALSLQGKHRAHGQDASQGQGSPLAHASASAGCSSSVQSVNQLRGTFLGQDFQAAHDIPIFQSIPLFIDGPHAIPLPQWRFAAKALQDTPQPRQFTVIKGDSLVPAISAAAILAKTQRDTFMQGAAAKYPQYAFEVHKGYGTAEHMRLLALHGSCPLHRKSFKVGGRQMDDQHLLLPF